jgi:hypothetical protein
VGLSSHGSWSVCHTKWEANGAAHGLAKEATRCFNDKIWLEDTPSCISHIANLELSALLLLMLWLLLSFILIE